MSPSPYRPISPRHHTSNGRLGPFADYVYTNRPAPRTTNPGFPGSTRGDTVRTWIPGVSTPEGLVVASTVSAVLVLPTGEVVLRVAQATASAVMVGVTLGFPAAAMWFGMNPTP